MSEQGYIDYFAILSLGPEAKPGEVRKQYKKKMKNLVMEIAQAEITEEKRRQYLRQVAELNAAFYILRDNDRRAAYTEARDRVIQLEQQWREAVENGSPEADDLRRQFDGALRDFLSTYMEELVLEAGRDKECVEASHWDRSHERHAERLLREHRQRLYQQIHQRLPYAEITKPEVTWDTRTRLVDEVLGG